MFHGKTKRDGSEPGAHPAIDDDGFVSVRRGYGRLIDPPSLLNSDYPTIYANPFRSAGVGDLVPIPTMRRAGTDTALLRSMGKPTLDALGTPTVNGLYFDPNNPVPDTQPVGLPLLSAGPYDPNNPDTPYLYGNTDRNSYFRYQPISRLGSMATTHSNVYAVWVTIGFFEVEEAPPRNDFATINGLPLGDPATNALYDRVYPEGYQLSQEMGSETGEFERLRGFAIVDRTIPVAFEPGEDHNVERAVRLRRRIE